VKSALRVLLIIEQLTDEPEGLNFVQICERLELPKSSAHALLRTIKKRHHLDPNQAGRCRLGVRVWEAGQAQMRGFDLATAPCPCFQTARDELQETVQLADLDAIEVLYLAKENSDQRLVLRSHVGAPLAAYAIGLSMVLLSGLSDEKVHSRLATTVSHAFTPTTITEPAKLLSEFEQERRRGDGTDHDEHSQGVTCNAVPIYNEDSTMVTTIRVSVPEIRAGTDFKERATEILARVASGLSALLRRSALATP
jgi:DNA-binding IclR family transcriptional regulator